MIPLAVHIGLVVIIFLVNFVFIGIVAVALTTIEVHQAELNEISIVVVDWRHEFLGFASRPYRFVGGKKEEKKQQA